MAGSGGRGGGGLGYNSEYIKHVNTQTHQSAKFERSQLSLFEMLILSGLVSTSLPHLKPSLSVLKNQCPKTFILALFKHSIA